MSPTSHISESEEDTKQRRITPAITNAGWSPNQIVMEYSLKADRYRIVPEANRAVKDTSTSRAKPDYILFREINCPIAVVEAKRKDKLAQDGLDQAISYAKMLDVPFAYASSGKDFIEFELFSGNQAVLKMDEFPSPEKLWKRWCSFKGISAEQEALFRRAPYYTEESMRPRYYQMQAINRTLDAIIIDKRKRILLVMATGTGKTYTAFQIVWRLKQAGLVQNVLYLADRNQLVDQTRTSDFAPFNTVTKIEMGKINQNYEIYFGLYQQLKRDQGGDSEGQTESLADIYKQVPPDYFDLIIVDECHRGSAREQSSWREILDYFSSAIQIGMTATPNEKDGSNNLEYFGAPLLTYSLKQGIEDGFLAPFQVVSVTLDKDVTGWEPAKDEEDLEGKPIPQRRYTLSDFDTTLEIRSRTKLVADCITRYLHHLGRMSKTIVFCNTQRHAATMRDAIREHNKDLVSKEPFYVVRMTADDEEGKGLYEDFISVNRTYPVVVTTSKLLSTGANTKCVKLIVLDSNIRSMTEFKQIIGRGTRLRPDADKTFFTILDFRGVCQLFSDPDFDGEPDNTIPWTGTGDPPIKDGGDTPPPKPKKPGSRDPREVYVVDNVPVEILGKATQYLDENGQLVTEKYVDYTRKSILSIYGSDKDFCQVWNGEKAKKTILQELVNLGVSFDQMRKELGNPNLDEFDMIRHIAFGNTNMFTREKRADKVRQTKFFDKYQGVARNVLERLLEAYASHGVTEIDEGAAFDALSTHCQDCGSLRNILKAFGGRDAVIDAVREMEQILYEAAI